MLALTVFSHLRWDFVYQRPQHLMSRLAEHYRVSFIEEPVYEACAPWLEVREIAPNLRLLRPHTPVPAPGFHDEQLPLLRDLLAPAMRDRAGGIAWLYTPMALWLTDLVKPRAVVYDCMDELTGFLHAPPELGVREDALLEISDVVFTGGRSLHALKRGRNPNTHCLPSSVDALHFAQALKPGLDHSMQNNLPRPRLGYYGVLDERLDTALLAEIADAHPDWQLVLAGPIAKIDPDSLPARSNIHYLGPQPYASLPALLAGWDVCLLPFAQNSATRYISPTKLLEYMAAAKPIVSTPIADVAEPYGDLVAIADSTRAFIAACEQALGQDDAARAAQTAAMRAVVAATSWERTAAFMHARIEDVLHRELPPSTASWIANDIPASNDAFIERDAPATVTQLAAARGRRAQARHTVIVGAGPTGLSAAWHLGSDTVLLEREPQVGGWCRSVVDAGFTFDCAGHILFSDEPEVQEMIRRLLGDNIHWQSREAWVYSHGVHTRYPFQGALYGLPAPVLKECLLGAIDAHIAAAYVPRESTADSGSPVLPLQRDAAAAPANFEEFIQRTWGAGVAKHFALPYNRKLWALPLTQMETSWIEGRVPLPDLAQMIEGALEPVPKPMGPNARFGYPLKGGFQALMDAFLPQIAGEVELDAEVVSIRPRERMVELADGRRYSYQRLISTMPLPALVRAVGEAAPREIHAAADALRHVSVRCVNLGIGREKLTDKHWIYYPEDTVFHRIFVQGNASPHCNPPGGFGLTCEISYSPEKPLELEGDALIQRCIDDCIRVGLIRADDPILCANEVDMPIAYVVYDHARGANVELIRGWMATRGIVLAGRYSEWEYYNSDHAFIAGKRAAEAVSDERAEATGTRDA